MIKFKNINKNKLKKLGSAVLITTMLGTSAFTSSGCDSNVKDSTQAETSAVTDSTTTQEIRTQYAVVVEYNRAIIYDEITVYNSQGDRWFKAKIDDTLYIELPKNTHILENCTLSDAKEYAGKLVSFEGVIKEFGSVQTFDIEQEKTFVKVKQYKY